MPKRTSDPLVDSDATLSAARLAAIVQASDDAIVSKTLEGIIVSWNSSAERMYGYTAAEIIGDSIYRLVPDRLRSEEQQILERVGRGEHVAHYETIRRRKDGVEFTISLSVSPLRDANGDIVGVSSIKRDITSQKRTEEILRQNARMESLGRLAGGLAHDFNNQLHALSGFTNFVSRDPGLSAASRHDLQEIHKAVERMASLTHQLLAFARRQVLNPETLDINSAVADMLPMLQRLIGSSVEIELELSEGPKWVRADRAQLAQVVMNLVINGRDAMPEGGRLIVQTSVLEVAPGQLLDRLELPITPGVYAELAVTDHGNGIAQEDLVKIFEPFYTTKRVGEGTGLGLATVEGIVSQSAGHIRVESKLGKGTTFQVLLPLTNRRSPIKATRITVTQPTELKRILVVEDEEVVRAVVVRTLRDSGYEAVGVRHGKEALEHLEQTTEPVNLVVTDLVMPVMGGRELVAELERRYPDLPIIWMSGHTRETGLPDLEPTKHGFLQKPVPPEVLLNAVAQAVRKPPGRH